MSLVQIRAIGTCWDECGQTIIDELNIDTSGAQDDILQRAQDALDTSINPHAKKSDYQVSSIEVLRWDGGVERTIHAV